MTDNVGEIVLFFFFGIITYMFPIPRGALLKLNKNIGRRERVGCASLIFLYSSILVLHALLKATRTALTRHKLSEFLICTMDFFIEMASSI